MKYDESWVKGKCDKYDLLYQNYNSIIIHILLI